MDKCVFFSQLFCVFLHSKASFGDLFLRFLCICFGIGLHYFCIVYAFFMFCCVIRTSFSVHHNFKEAPLRLL